MGAAAEKKADSRPSHLWTSSAEPHAQRRKLMLQKYGAQIRPLMGNNPWTVVPVATAALLQTAFAAAIGLYNVPWWGVIVLGYLLSPFLAGNLMAAHHEISHFLVFKRPVWNRVLWVAANMPLAAPLGSLFKQYHHDHHLDMGTDGTDTGIWTAVEAGWVSPSWVSKFILLLFFPIPFFFRPFFMRINKQLELVDLMSWLVIPAYDVALCYFGGRSLKPLAYLLLGLYFGVGLHPIAGHVISEHCSMGNDGQETHSCYDPLLNPLLYNFGYHVEHHDFQNIPWNRLPLLRGIAPEFYAHLTSYPSWTGVIWRFITDPTVGAAGVMTKRVERSGGSKGALLASSPPATALFRPAAMMPLLKGVTASAIN